MVEVAVAVGVGALAGAAVTGAVQFYKDQRSQRWSSSSRPASHPLKCDFRKSLGYLVDEEGRFHRHTDHEVKGCIRRAPVWWHEDKNGNQPHWPRDRNAKNTRKTWDAFDEMSKLFLKKKWRDDYELRVQQRMASLLEAQQEVEDEEDEDDEAEDLPLMSPTEWLAFNREFMKSAAAPAVGATQMGPVDKVYTQVATVRQVFLDISGSMRARHKPGVTRLQRSHNIFGDVFLGFSDDEVPTLVHLIGSRAGDECSKRIVADSDQVSEKFDEIMAQWTSNAGETYLWEYANTELLKHKNVPVQEVIIITDGSDNGSPSPFNGVQGFQALTQQWDPRNVKLQDAGERQKADPTIRFSLFLIGNCDDQELLASYRDLCQATGGQFHHEGPGSDESLAQNWIVPLLLPEGEREHLALENKREYLQRLTNGDAVPIQGFLALTSGVEQQPAAFAPPPRSLPRGVEAMPMPVSHSAPMVSVPLASRERHLPRASV